MKKNGCEPAHRAVGFRVLSAGISPGSHAVGCPIGVRDTDRHHHLGKGIAMRHSALAAQAAALVTLSAGSQAQVVIHSNFGPGDDFNMVSGNLVLGPDEVSIGNVDQAMRFTVGAIDTYFTSAQLALRLTDGLDFVNIHLMSDAGGLPGASLLTIGVSGLPGPDAPGIVTASAGAAVLLSANTTYWIAADAGGDTEIVWHRNNIGDLGRAGRGGNPVGPWNFNPDQETLAFRVNGRLVPTPGSASVALLACGVLASRRRREGAAL